MTQNEWDNLSVGDNVRIGDGRIFSVGEIAKDEKTLNCWLNRGYTNVNTIVKLLGENNYHTWDCNYIRWEKVND